MLERVGSGGLNDICSGPACDVFHLFRRGLVREIRPVPRPCGPADLRAQLLSR